MNYEYEFIRHIEATSFKFFFVSMIHRLYHWHNDIEILLVVDGSVTLETKNQKFKLLKNDIFLLNSNEVHSLTKTNETNTILAIQFDPKFCKTYFPQLQQIYFRSQYITDKNNLKCWTQLKRYFLQIVKDCYLKEKWYTLKLMSTLHLVICCLVENLDYEDATEKEQTSLQKNLDRLNRIILYVKLNYMHKLSLKELAEKENLDMFYLSRFVKKHLGISFQEYLNKVRLEKAVGLLLGTNRKCLDISIECGFSDYRYLNKLFLKEFGCTPAEYKKLYKNPDDVLVDNPDKVQKEIIHNGQAIEAIIKNLEIST
ncbi:Hypothetical protein LUCI_0141 [Lucifera butyrica]|uniref:HTH araC/xylS-type domain-containing protein n=1 Tax=Lucifera butyrica TaxID=1351585 RepID=A0A498R1A4_9FIRM|nr:AraC family transcriptional regulator [Lucifera butyrica]VBB04935.1 Hypothetical protein LUCI_0141 [Lucifera butyrica]